MSQTRNDASDEETPSRDIRLPNVRTRTPVNWLPQHMISGQGRASHKAASHDGADSGIDVVNVQEAPLFIHSAPGEYSNVRQTAPAYVSTSNQFFDKNSSYPYYSDPSFMRWGTSRLGRRAADPRETDRFLRLATASASFQFTMFCFGEHDAACRELITMHQAEEVIAKYFSQEHKRSRGGQRARNEKLGSMLSDGTLRMPGKLVTWHVAMESRPPLRIDMSGPTPTTYSPRNKPLYETNAPAYSFGRKDPEIKGSGQKAWAKLWFRSHSPFTHKTNYELNWPTAPHYEQKSTLGPKQASRPGYPSHSIGVRQNLMITGSLKPDIPASNQYEPDLAKYQVMARAPAFSMGTKLPSTHWIKSVNVPAPNAYNPRLASRMVKPTYPSYTMCVERRFKRHDVGPFVTL